MQEREPEEPEPDTRPPPGRLPGKQPGKRSPVGRRVSSQRDLVIASLIAKPDDGRDEDRRDR